MMLLPMNLQEIDEFTEGMSKEARALKDSLYKYCWYMRGGMTITEAYNLTMEDQEIISKLIESNIETTQKTKLPFF